MLFCVLLIPLMYCITKTNINKEIIFFGIALYFIFHLYQKNRIEGSFFGDIADSISDTLDSIVEGSEDGTQGSSVQFIFANDVDTMNIRGLSHTDVVPRKSTVLARRYGSTAQEIRE